jgi:predicted nucleic acid-binding protein
VILDTNALSAFADGHAEIEPFVRSVRIALPVVVLGEYSYGIANSNRRNRYEPWLETLLQMVQILEITRETTLWYARVRTELRHKGTPIPANDAWIAALSLQHHLPILSQNRHFDKIADLRRVGW